MKTKISVIKSIGKVLFAILFLFVLTPACIEYSESELMDQEIYNQLLKSKIIPESSVQLKGFSRMAYFKKVENEFIFDELSGTYYDGYENNFLISDAVLTFGEGMSFELSSTDYVDFDLDPETVTDRLLFRKITFKGKITPSGQLKFTWPDKWLQFDFVTGDLAETEDILGQIALHTGFTLSGPGITANTIMLTGNFDGDKLFAEIKLNGLQEQPGIYNPFNVVIQGPVLVNPILEMEVMD